MRERERLIARIRQMGRGSKLTDAAQDSPAGGLALDRLRTLEMRVEHLESLVQGLQDSVHRESSRQSKRITELEAQIQPAALGKALSDDVRSRGL